jgi:hypothetical protein
MADIAQDFMTQFGAGLDAAVGERHLPNPLLSADNQNEIDSGAYIRAIRARLIELGYLAEGVKQTNRANNELDPILSQKIKRFQKEAGIRVDGWAGPNTWRVLECLVSFENQQHPEHWHQVWPVPEPVLTNQAVLRGIYCRLYTMGFFSDWLRHRMHTQTVISPQHNPDFQSAIDKFCLFAKQLGLVTPACAGLSVELLHALYQYDNIVNRLADEVVFAQVQAAFQHTIEAIARIELWLLGYDIVPGKDQTERKKARARSNSKIRRPISKTRRAISRFCKDNSQVMPGFIQQDKVTAALMAAFSQLAAEPSKDIYLGKQLNSTVRTILADKTGNKEFHSQFNKLANGIFDGIKRVIRWLFRKVQQLGQFTKEFIANIVRFISKKARKFYVGVVKAFDIVHAGTTYLKSSAYHYTTPAKLLFSHDNDFDQFCLISPNLTPEQITQDVTQYRLRAKLYAASLNIISHLMRMAHRVLKTVIAPFGWLLALLALAELANSVKAIKQQIALVQTYELNISHKQALFNSRIS